MQACVFLGGLFVLVNDKSTKEINKQKCLKNGGHVAPFLFLLLVAGLINTILRVG